jgi:hypothetical protein
MNHGQNQNLNQNLNQNQNHNLNQNQNQNQNLILLYLVVKHPIIVTGITIIHLVYNGQQVNLVFNR